MTEATNSTTGSGSERDGVIERHDGTKYLEPERANAFLGLVRAGDSLARRFDRTLQDEHGLSLHQFEVLLFLAVFAEDHTMQMTELRHRTPLSQSRVSRVVAGLEADGLVARGSDPNDSRAVNVTITAQGTDVFKAAQDRHLDDLEQHLFSLLTDREIRQLATITHKILSAYQHQPRA